MTKTEDKLPSGYEMSDGKTAINGEVHPEGVIVGPHERGELKTYECPRCKATTESPSPDPVCQGAILAVKDREGVIHRSGFGEDGEPVLITGGKVVLDDDGGKKPAHAPTIMKAVKA